MAAVAVVGLSILFVIGALLGIAIGAVAFLISLVRGARAVHAEGVVCRAELIARDSEIGPRLAGPALVRLSGGIASQTTSGTDILGLDIRMQRHAVADATVGDQDLLLGTFESFMTIARDRAATNARSYLANRYSSVTPWWVSGSGPSILRLRAVQHSATPDGPVDRIATLDADIAAGRACMVLSVHGSGNAVDVAELRLVERLPQDANALRTSMFRQGRALRPLGLRNGIRATVYPLSQLARRLRGR